MEKKSKFSQSSSKGTSSDAKKNQDVSGSRPFPKSSRKREPAGASNFSKYDQPKKSFSQKGKNFDKRPKPKGYYHGSTKEDSKVVEDEMAEPGSLTNQGCKKQNLNHLLNFHYAPRNIRNGSEEWNRRSSNYSHNSNRWLPPVQRHKYNKEQFLQANCQFIVNVNGDYTAYLADPDILVDWKLIEQIRLHTSDKLSCPICLCSPVAGKMTRCGHVFCWACILHYLALSDKSWRKCPICYEAVHVSDLKSVVEVTQNNLKIGDMVRLRLMRRERGSLITTSVPEKEAPAPTDFFSVSVGSHSQVYSKLLLANVNDILDIIECERVQLQFEMMDDPHSPENCFIEQALGELLMREKEIMIQKQIFHPNYELKKEELIEKSEDKTRNNQSDIQIPITISKDVLNPNIENDNQVGEIASKQNPELKVNTDPQFEIVKSWWDGEECELVASKADTSMMNVQPPKEPENFVSSNIQKFIYFYQAENGQNVYLHTMNVKMLEMQYGSLDRCPRMVMGRLLEKEDGSLTEELRRRMRYLCHLPITCQFEIAEIELLPPLISEDVLEQFRDQLDIRQRKRQRKQREERRREKKINEEENKRMGKFPTRKVHIESNRHFPQWQPEPQTGVVIPTSPELTASSSLASSPSSLSTFDEVSPIGESFNWPSNNTDSGPSFAQMLRQHGNRSSDAWPSIKPRSNTLPENPPPVNPLDDDGYVSLRTLNPTFGDALAQALEQSSLVESEKPVDVSNGAKKKKKKNKPTLLFATSMARAP